MAEFPSKISTQTSTPDVGSSATLTWKFISLDVGFVKSAAGILMVLEIALGLLVWALIADSHYHHVPAYGWVMFVAVFCWIVTVILFVLYLLQLHLKLPMVPWSIVMLAYNLGAATLYITGFITCSAAVQSATTVSDYNKRAAASFFACIVMLCYGASTFFSSQMWWGHGSNAATSQASGSNNRYN
ncbi:plasmolipin [Ambystoma mexicanum]|uniref:plasmolipin n=1 Tax=Ambystoma mexicanum TaxID=8296 RepID=UPI0037E7C72C